MRNMRKRGHGSVEKYCMSLWQKSYLIWLPLVLGIGCVAVSLAVDLTTGQSQFFSRSGAIMAMSGVWVGYIEAKWSFVSDEDDSGRFSLFFDPDESLKKYATISFFYGLFGTAIWGYGDLLL